MTPPTRFGVGQPVARKEDDRLLTGRGAYTGDLDLPGQLHGAVVRSPYAHAELGAIDAGAALARPGVVAVLTGEDVAADGLGPLPALADTFDPSGEMRVHILGPHPKVPPRPVLARGRVRFVGDAVAFAVAESEAAARDAADLVEVAYTPLPAVAATGRAADPGMPRIWEEWPGNLAFTFENGDRAATEAAFAAAERAVAIELVNNRVVANSMEPRVAIGEVEGEVLRLHVGCQGPHNLRNMLADSIFGLPPARVDVVAHEVGGGFGMKYMLYGEYALVMWAARRLGRPVKWVSGRAEAFLSDAQGRDHVTRMELALDAGGRFLALRSTTTANMGAYYSNLGPAVPTIEGEHILTSVYKVGAVHNTVRGVFTNTVPTDAYRGAGRPELNYRIERVIDAAARELGLDASELRRRNFIGAADFPYANGCGETIDSGDFAGNTEAAMQLADWRGIGRRRAEAQAGGRLRGIGMAYYVDEVAGPMLGGEEAALRVGADRTLTGIIGTVATGQGHETAFAQILHQHLGVPFEAIRLEQGDLEHIPASTGQGGSRTVLICGLALTAAADDAVEKGRQAAAELLEAAAADIEFSEGRYRVAGTDRAVDLFAVGAAMAEGRAGPARPLLGHGEFFPAATTFPNGCHVCEVDIDRDTGAVAIADYVVVDDFGRVVNPLLLAGQIHGGIAQGAGQALLEHTVYGEDGQLLSATLMDYALPRAGDLPSFRTRTREILCATNPLGMKGAGEAGTIGAPPAVVNAILDALAPLGITRFDMPATPERVWRAMREADPG